MERRTAISGLIPARPFRMPDSVLRLTPSDRAASVTVKFRGSRHSALSTSPGCGGLCIFMFTSVVVLVVHTIHVLGGASECDAPVPAHLDGPRALFGATESVEIQARQVHVARAGGRVQAAKY